MSFGREFFARGFCFAQHARERPSIEMALIKRDPAFLDHARDNSRFGCARTDRANAALAALRNAINFRTHLRRGQKRITPPVHRRAAGMRGLSAECERVSFHAKSP